MTTIQPRLWTVEEYHRMIEAGIFHPQEKVELLDGKIIQKSPQRPPHAATTQRSDRYLQNLLRDRAAIRVQLPITLFNSEPEPDIAVVNIDPNGYMDRHPDGRDIFFLIEIAYSTLELDRNEKSSLYARSFISDYWILDIVERQAYILREPSKNSYQSETILTPSAAIAPLAFPDITIPLSELFLPQI